MHSINIMKITIVISKIKVKEKSTLNLNRNFMGESRGI